MFNIDVNNVVTRRFTLGRTSGLGGLVLNYAVTNNDYDRTKGLRIFFDSSLLGLLFAPSFVRRRRASMSFFFRMARPCHDASRTLVQRLGTINNRGAYSALKGVITPALILAKSDSHVVPPRGDAFLTRRVPNTQRRAVGGTTRTFDFDRPGSATTTVVGFLRR